MAVPRGLGNTYKSDPGRSSLEEEIKGEDDEHKAAKIAQSMPPPSLSYNQQCPKHGLLIHSYLRTDNQELLCTRCIYERNLSHPQLELIPQVVKDIKANIESTRVLITYRRAQMCQGLKYLQRMQRANREVVQNKLGEHISKIRRVVDLFEAKMKSDLEDLEER